MPAVADTSPTISRRRAVMAAKARPSTSRSERGVTSRVRSPPAIASAVSAVSRSDSAMRPKAPAMRPTSSCVRAFTVTSRSPSPIRSAASATSRTGRLRRPATNTSAPPTSSSADQADEDQLRAQRGDAGQDLVLRRDGHEAPAAGLHRRVEHHDVTAVDGVLGLDPALAALGGLGGNADVLGGLLAGPPLAWPGRRRACRSARRRTRSRCRAPRRPWSACRARSSATSMPVTPTARAVALDRRRVGGHHRAAVEVRVEHDVAGGLEAA